MFTIPFTRRARERKEAKATLTAARVFVLSHEDLPAFAKRKDFQELNAAWLARDGLRCSELLSQLDAPKRCQMCREWLDILVVSISVAMAFRAYFYEPFNIPTGSMQPTLYGNHSEPCSEPDFFDRTPLKWLKWAVSGYHYKDYTAPFAGRLAFQPTNTGRYDMRVMAADGRVSESMMVPTDVLRGNAGDAPSMDEIPHLPNGLKPGDYVRAGQRLWQGYDVTGDFLFVNRWLWNFRHPKRGDVMIFSTTGIPRLQQGTHYIKRMTGLPGETIEIISPDVYVNGVRTPNIKPTVGARGERMPIPSPAVMEGSVKLAKDEYFACGDNSDSSYDSRYWGVVPAKNLCGIAGGVFWPLRNARWGVVK